MNKKYEVWHKCKSEIEENDRYVLFSEQEIWWCSLGVNIGVESDGKNNSFERPVLIFKKFNKDMFWAIPITSKPKPDRSYFYSFQFHDTTNTLQLSQLRAMSSKRLIRSIGKVSESLFIEMKRALINLIVNNADPFRGPTDSIKNPPLPIGNNEISINDTS